MYPLSLWQMFFDADVFLRFVEDCRRIGITVPIIPGVMLIQNAGGFQKMTHFCKTRVPADIKRRFEAVKDDAEAVKELGVEVGTEMSRALLAGGVPGLHYYTLNLEKVRVALFFSLCFRSCCFGETWSDFLPVIRSFFV